MSKKINSIDVVLFCNSYGRFLKNLRKFNPTTISKFIYYAELDNEIINSISYMHKSYWMIMYSNGEIIFS